MRTSVLVGLLYIGDAIGKPEYMASGSISSVIGVIAVVFVVAIVMDVVDFFRSK